MTRSRFVPPNQLEAANANKKTDTSEVLPRILYVEDEDLNWDVAHAQMSSKYILERAVNARGFFEKYLSKTYDLVLMDIQLTNSDMDGIALVRTMKKNPEVPLPSYIIGKILPPAPPIIVVTAYSARYSRADILTIGADDLITKPVNLTGLSLVISRLVARRIVAS